MDKKLYIQPQTEIIKAVFSQMFASSPGVTGNIGDDSGSIGYGGVDDNPEAGSDVKGESWSDIWE